LSAALLALACGSCVQPRRLATIETPPACRSAVTRAGSPASLAWVMTSSDDRLTLDDWCRTVGPAIVDDSPAPSSPRRLEDVVIVSWNVEVGGGDVDALLDRLGAAAPDLHRRPIVALLQEAFRGGPAVPPVRTAASVPGRIAPTPPSGFRRSIEE